MAVNSAGNLASQQLKSSESSESAPKGMGSQFMTTAAMATGNLAKAAMADIGSRLGGQHMGYGTMGGRMSADMDNQASQLQQSQIANDAASTSNSDPIQTQLKNQSQEKPQEENSIESE